MRRAELDAFLGWLMSSRTQCDLGGGTGRSFRDRHAWCWNVRPTIAVTAEIYDEVQLDGTYLSGGWCLLAINGANGEVIAWQWCDREKTAAWEALIAPIPAPRVVVTDGGSGLPAALAEHWPETKVQRCLVHVQRNVRREVTTRPRTDAGKALRRLSLDLTRIRTREQAAAWAANLNDWHQVYGDLINAKTYLTDVSVRPSTVKATATWWWTHERLRRAYKLLERLVRRGHLFTYLNEEFDELGIHSTTNWIEGGCNHPLKDLLRRHRGMTINHRRRACEWWCYLHSPKPKPPTTWIRDEHWQPAKPAPVVTAEPDGPAGYDHAIATAEEGLWTRKGWAGRPS